MLDHARDKRDVVRFWEKVDMRGSDECWNWTAGKSHNGYGHFTCRFKNIRAHVYSFMLNVGPIPTGLIVLHSCDNPSCVNPSHLKAGSHGDNNADMVSRWRHRYGSTHPQSKLTEDTVRQLREYRCAHGAATYQQVGEVFGVSAATAHKIVKRQLWRHV